MSLDSGDTEITLDRSRLNLIKHYRTYYSNSKNEEPLTTYQEESRKQFGEEYERNILMRLLIDNWTGKDFDEQAKITHGMSHGSGRHKKLLDESRDHMFKVSKQMTDSEINKTLNVLREISFMAEGFGDILYQEGELRKKKGKMDCQ
jgi:hypothetical protein